MGGNNELSNIIPLSYKDHFNAHIILAQCFDKNRPEYSKNICSANKILSSLKRILYKNNVKIIDDFWEEANLQIKQLISGKGNPFYGHKHSDETKLIISKKNTGRLLGENNPMYGKSHSIDTKEKISLNSKLILY